MKISKLPFIKGLKKYTDQTLRNKPNKWSIRLPWVLFFVLLSHLLITALVVLTEWDVRKYFNEDTWYGFLSVVVLLGAVFYCIYLFRFNVFKRFGQLPRFYFLRTFIGFFAVFSLLATCFFTPTWVTTIMARMQYDDEVVAKDINRINTLVASLEKDSMPKHWTRFKVEFLPQEDILPDSINHYDENIQEYNYRFYRNHYDQGDANVLDELSAQEKLLEEAKADQVGYFDYGSVSYVDSAEFSLAHFKDSVVVLNETQLYIFKCPDYLSINGLNGFFDQTDIEEVTDKELFYSVINSDKQIDEKAIKTELEKLLKEYTSYAKVSRYNDYNYGHYEGVESVNKSYKDYSLGRLKSSLQNVSKKYYRWDASEWFMIFTILYYTSLVLTLFLFLFRHNRIKDYFLSILTAIILAIITGVTIGLFGYNLEEDLLAILISIYIGIAIVLSLRILTDKRAKLSSKIGMNLLIFVTPFIPFISSVYYYYVKRTNFNRKYDGLKDRELYRSLQDKAFEYEGVTMVLSQVVGAILLLVLIHWVYSKMLKRAYALPKV